MLHSVPTISTCDVNRVFAFLSDLGLLSSLSSFLTLKAWSLEAGALTLYNNEYIFFKVLFKIFRVAVRGFSAVVTCLGPPGDGLPCRACQGAPRPAQLLSSSRCFPERNLWHVLFGMGVSGTKTVAFA